MNKVELRAKRAKSHGPYKLNAEIAQGCLRVVMETAPHFWESLSDTDRHSIYFIWTKIARKITGDRAELDHARDIAGYADLMGAEGENSIAEMDRTLARLSEAAE